MEQCNIRTKVVVLQVLSNTLCRHTVNDTYSQLSNLIYACETVFGGARLCVGEALPRRLATPWETSTYTRKVSELNAKLYNCENVTVIPHDNLQKMPSPYLGLDGIHLTPIGTGQLVRNFKIITNPLLGLRDYSEYTWYNQSHNQPEKSQQRLNTRKEYREDQERQNYYRENKVNRDPVQVQVQDTANEAGCIQSNPLFIALQNLLQQHTGEISA